MTKPQLAVITIGQAPREDVLPSIYNHFPQEAILHIGVLDGLSAADIEELAPTSVHHEVLTSRLKNGMGVKLAKNKIAPLLQNKIDFAEAQGCQLIYLLCTGSFTNLKTKKSLLIEPDGLITAFLQKINGGNYSLGVLLPLPEQQNDIAQKYQKIPRVVYFSLSPYEKITEEKVAAARNYFEQAGCSLVILDCMGYSQEIKKKIFGDSQVLALLANELIISVLKSMTV